MFLAHKYFFRKLLSSKVMTGEFSDFQTSELFTLETLGEKSWISMKELAAALNVAPNTTTGIVDRLVRREIVKRRHSQVDRRVIKIGLTKKGEGFYKDYLDLHVEYGRGLLEALTEKEAKDYVDIIEKMVKKVEADQGEE